MKTAVFQQKKEFQIQYNIPSICWLWILPCSQKRIGREHQNWASHFGSCWKYSKCSLAPLWLQWCPAKKSCWALTIQFSTKKNAVESDYQELKMLRVPTAYHGLRKVQYRNTTCPWDSCTTSQSQHKLIEWHSSLPLTML